ncbi:MAG: phage late control D family protein [Azoarcus sp.]|jgi:phage protein D|nr:phage late control D family protein [Azoarcus sp.]
MSAIYPQALWRLTLEEHDLTYALEPRLMQLTLTDNRGLDADELNITLSDADGRIAIPERGVRLYLALGWDDTGLIDKGSYTVDEIEHSGAPDQLTIRAHSADLRETLLVKKERSWHNTTIGAIVKKIAKENKLTASVSPELAPLAVKHIDQQSESDANILTRLGEQYDAMAAVKDGQLIFFAIERGMTISGTPLPEVSIVRGVGDSHRFAVSDRVGCPGVTAYYYDKKAGKKGSVTIREADITPGDKKKNDKVEASGGNVKVLRHTYSNAKHAARAAKSALQKALRAASTFNITLARGRPDIIPELPATVAGWKPEIDSAAWRIVRVTHSLSPSGLTSDLELELQIGGDAESDGGEQENGDDK